MEILKPDDVVIIPAFGTEIGLLEQIKSKGCHIVDTTCGDVMNVWKRVRQKERGVSYAVNGPLDAPDGSRLQVRSVGFIETDKETPKFVTAHPLPKP